MATTDSELIELMQNNERWTPLSEDHLQGGWSQQAADVVGLFRPGMRGEFWGPLAGLNASWQRLTNPDFINHEVRKQFGVEHRKDVNDPLAWNEAKNKIYDDYLNKARGWEQHYGLNINDNERDILMDALAAHAHPQMIAPGGTTDHVPGLSGTESRNFSLEQYSQRMRDLSDLLHDSDLTDRLTYAHTTQSENTDQGSGGTDDTFTRGGNTDGGADDMFTRRSRRYVGPATLEEIRNYATQGGYSQMEEILNGTENT